MTNEEQKAQEAQTLLGFSETQKKIACLTSALKDMGKSISDLGSSLSNYPDRVASVSEDGTTYRLRKISGGDESEIVSVDLPLLGRRLRELESAIRHRDELVNTLQETGHGHVLPDRLRNR